MNFRVFLKIGLFIAILSVPALVGISARVLAPATGNIVISNGVDLFIDDIAGIKVIKLSPRQLTYLFATRVDSPFASYIEENGLSLAVNGGYFRGSNTSAQHAGLLVQNGRQISRVAPLDKQLTHVVVQDLSNQLRFERATANATYSNARFAFQTGPLVVEKDQLATAFIEDSLNGENAYKRTLLGKSPNYYYLVVTTNSYTLSQIAGYLSQQSYVEEALDLINLDGGTSSTLYIKNNIDHSVNTRWFIPSALGF